MDQKTQITPPPYNANPVASQGNALYGRTPGKPDIKRTYIQGMKPRRDVSGNNPDAASGSEPDTRALNISLQGRPIAGVLFSVSRDNMGELFPVYVGRNTIGSEAECDIYLTEETVSPNHAVLLVRMLPNASGGRTMNMSITDYDSDFGTAVNGMKLGYDRQSLAGREVIQIGNSYQFLFIPLDAQNHGLVQIPGFIATPRKEMRSSLPATGFYAPATEEEIYPSAVGEEDERTFYGRTYAKKEDHSSKKTIL